MSIKPMILAVVVGLALNGLLFITAGERVFFWTQELIALALPESASVKPFVPLWLL